MEDYAGQMLGVTLFLVGLVVSWIVWRRRGAASGLRGFAWSFLLLGAGLAGLIDALWSFGVNLVGSILNPVLWAGLGAAGLAVVLYIVSGVMKARGVGTKGRGKKAPAEGQSQVEGGGGRGQVGAGSEKGTAQGAAQGSDKGEDDFSDIEAILRERGIT